MIWYRVTFPNSLYYQREIDKLIFKFNNMYKAFQKPSGFCLYKSNYNNNTVHEYFISSPDKYDYYLKIPLSVLDIQLVPEPPNKSKLELIAGSKLTEDQ